MKFISPMIFTLLLVIFTLVFELNLVSIAYFALLLSIFVHELGHLAFGLFRYKPTTFNNKKILRLLTGGPIFSLFLH